MEGWKRSSKRRILFTAGAPDIGTIEVLTSAATQISSLQMRNTISGHTAHTHTLMEEEITLEHTFISSIKHV